MLLISCSALLRQFLATVLLVRHEFGFVRGVAKKKVRATIRRYLRLKSVGLSQRYQFALSRYLKLHGLCGSPLRRQIVFEEHQSPSVSVIIFLPNDSYRSSCCLYSILASKPRVSYEVIGVNSGQGASERQFLGLVKGVKLIQNQVRLSFPQLCNEAVALASGEHLLFLSGNAVVHAGWMDELGGVLAENMNAGLVGSQMIGSDGKLENIGYLLSPDGTALPLGATEFPDHPAFSYLQEVDSCSASSFMVRRCDLQKVNGFHSAYLTEEYCCADLAFRLRTIGKKTLVQPLSRITAFQNQSYDSKEINELWQQDKIILNQNWASSLLGQQINEKKSLLSGRQNGRPRILFIDATVPMPDRGAGGVDAYFYMQFLLEFGYDVVFYAEAAPYYVMKYTPQLQRIGVECIYEPDVRIEKYLAERGEKFSFVIVARYPQARRMDYLLQRYCYKAAYIFNTVDVHFIREFRQAEIEDSDSLRATAKRTREDELKMMQRADVTIVISEEEKRLLETKYGQHGIHHIPLIRKVHGCRRSFRERKNLVFIGSGHAPNVDGVVYFCKEIFPLICQQMPELELIVIGEALRDQLAQNSDITDLDMGSKVTYVGFVDDLAEYFDRIRLMVAPLRYGAGVKGKIATAMSYGVPCISTSIGIEGMGLCDGINVLEADEPQDFANAVVRCYTSSNLWERLSNNGLRFMEDSYSSTIGKKRLFDVLCAAQLAAEKRRPSGAPCAP